MTYTIYNNGNAVFTTQRWITAMEIAARESKNNPNARMWIEDSNGKTYNRDTTMTTLQAQRIAIRNAVRALEYEIVKQIRKGTPADDEIIVDIRTEIQALQDASEALQAADAFKASMKIFLGVA